MKLIIKI